MELVKRHLGLLMAGLVIVAGTAFVATQQLVAAPSGGDTVTLAQNDGSTDAPAGDRPAGDGAREHRPGAFPRAIRGEMVVPARDGEGYATVRFDRGIVERVDGTTVVIKEDDGTSVEISTDDGTRVYRDGQDAELSDLQAGDHAAAFRVKEGDAFLTKGIRVISPEQWEDGQDRRDGMRDRMRERFEQRRANRDA